MSNKLLLAVNFLGVDKLSGSIRNIVASSKAGSASLKDMKNEARALERELKDVKAAQAAGSGSWSQLALRERELTRQIEQSNRLLDQRRTKLERIARIQGRAGKVADFASGAGQRASLMVTAPLTAFGVAAAKAAIDAEELQSAFNVTFGKNAAMMNKWSETTGKSMGRSKVEMKQAANTFGIFFNQAAPAEKAAAMSRQFAVLAQDLGSFFNTDTQTAIQKLRSGLSGESEPLRDFGVFLTEANVKAKALAMGLKPVGKELSEQQKIMARYALIMDLTKKAQGDVARTSGSTANQIRAAKAAWDDLKVDVGQKLIPAITPLIALIGSAITKFSELSPGTQKFLLIGAAAGAALGPLLLAIGGIASAVAVLTPLLIGSGAAVAMFVGVWLPLAAVVGFAAYEIYSKWDKIKATFGAGLDWIAARLTAAKSWFAGLGAGIMNGLLLMLNPARLAARMIDIAKAGVTAFKSFFGIKSPSRLMMAMGGHVAGGLAMGLDRGAGGATRSMSRLAAGVTGAAALGLASPAMAMAPGAGRAPAQSAAGVTYNVNINLSGTEGQDPRQLAQAIKRELDALLAQEARGSYADV